MKLVKVFKILELTFIIFIILFPIVFFTTSLSIEYRRAVVGLKEGDIIQLTITDYNFNYNVTDTGEYNVSAGIYLTPILDFKDGEVLIQDVENIKFSSITLFEGNSTRNLKFNFTINSLGDEKITAVTTLVQHNRQFALGLFYYSAVVPFLEPSLAVGLTFSKADGATKVAYVNWRGMFVFSTKKAREALDWHSKNDYFSPFNFAQEDKNTYNTIYYDRQFFSATTYRLRQWSNKLDSVTSTLEGIVDMTTYSPFFSNMTAYSRLPYVSYWKYHIEFELLYFRGGRVF